MKNTFFLFAAGLMFSASASAQSTVDSIAAKYQLLPMPQAMTIEKTFPVIGTYQLTNAASATETVTVSLDANNKGMVWIEGLPQGKMKAYLKQAPATYRIIAQKTESGKSVPEGTLIFDPATNVLNVALGKAFDNTDPAAIFSLQSTATADAGSNNEVKVKTKTASSKTKSKVTFYSATRADVATTNSDTAPATVNPTQQK